MNLFECVDCFIRKSDAVIASRLPIDIALFSIVSIMRTIYTEICV